MMDTSSSHQTKLFWGQIYKKLKCCKKLLKAKVKLFKENLDGLFSKSGKLKYGQECSYLFDEGIIAWLGELRNTLESILKDLKKRGAVQRDVSWNIVKNNPKKRSRKQNKNKIKKEESSSKRKRISSHNQSYSFDECIIAWIGELRNTLESTLKDLKKRRAVQRDVSWNIVKKQLQEKVKKTEPK